MPFNSAAAPGLPVPFDGHPGTVRHAFKGRLAGKRLATGRYTVVITATNGTGHWPSVSLRFRVTG